MRSTSSPAGAVAPAAGHGSGRLAAGAPAAGAPAAATSLPHASGPPADAVALTRWRARLDALTRWCLSELPLAPAVADAVPGGRPTLGDLLRRALGCDGAGVVDLLDALDAPDTPTARALLGRVLGADLLLVVVTLRGSTIVRADARACRSPAEAAALVDAYLGRPAAHWVPTAGVAVLGDAHVPTLATSTDGRDLYGSGRPSSSQREDSAATTILLPFLPLDGRAVAAAAPGPVAVATEPPLVMLPAILGGTLRPGAAFLDADLTLDDADDEEAHADDAARDHDAQDDDPQDDAPDEHDAPQHDAPHHDAPRANAPDGRGDTPSARGRDEVEVSPADAAGALDRLRARTTAAADRVSALIATDDGAAEHVGDAAVWLAEASEQELRALVRGGWSGDSALEVALALADEDPEADEVVQWGRRHESELVVEIDGDAAVAWLRRHRPDTAERLAAVL